MLPYQENDLQTQNNNSSLQLPQDESTTSLSLLSQPSLPSIPSLTSSHLPFYPTTNITQEYSCLATINCGGPAYISSLTVAGKYLYAGSSTGDIYSWKRASLISSNINNNNNGSSNIIATCNGSIKSLVLLYDKLFSAHQDHKIRVWKIANRTDNNHSIDDDDDDDKPQVTYTKIATLPTLTDRAISIINAKPRVRIHRHKSCSYVHHADTVSALALSADRSLLYSVSWDRTLKVWRMEDFRCVQSISNAHDDALNTIASSPDGRVYTGSADKKIKIWKKKKKNNEKELLSCSSTLEKHNSGINALALNSKGTVLYSGACDRSIIVWKLKEDDCNYEDEDREDGKSMMAIGALRGHTKSILCLVVVGDVVFSGSADKTIRVWKGFGGNNYNNNGFESSYACLAVLRGHQGPVKCFTATVDRSSNYSNNGYDDDDADAADSFVVYSGSLNHDLKVWRISVPLI